MHEFWIAEPAEHVIYQNQLVKGKYELVAIMGGDDVLKPRHFPGLEIKVSEVFKP